MHSLKTKQLSKPKHEECMKNYEGTSGSMEVASAMSIFHRSEKERSVRYSQFLGDGDSKAYKTLSDSMAYENVPITKLESVGDVQKRMGIRLKQIETAIGKNCLIVRLSGVGSPMPH
ncbi:hypothetical protein ANN_22233 [Periplaneta americana]|uniref:Mutator-like transposase domain-containing protein n=1 Tax=Periplaneta americana TaxID=6978 RepID=A0ABQ8S845_PERAM|nr:hypothetical protein ANN_22233 [Periplaneta americana]